MELALETRTKKNTPNLDPFSEPKHHAMAKKLTKNKGVTFFPKQNAQINNWSIHPFPTTIKIYQMRLQGVHRDAGPALLGVLQPFSHLSQGM